MYMIDTFHPGKNFTTLGKLRKISYQDKIFNRTVQSRKYSSAANGLKHSINDTTGNIFLGCIAICFPEQRSCGIYR